jgi:hypothetical protein
MELRSGKKKVVVVEATNISGNEALVGDKGYCTSVAGLDAYSFGQGHFGKWSTCYDEGYLATSLEWVHIHLAMGIL